MTPCYTRHETAPGVHVDIPHEHERHDMDESHISTYPVGLLADLKHRRKLKTMLGYLRYQVERGNWRAVRNYFNGYLAEWHYPPEGMLHYRCGKGWTRRAALRRLGAHLVACNAPEVEGDRL